MKSSSLAVWCKDKWNLQAELWLANMLTVLLKFEEMHVLMGVSGELVKISDLLSERLSIQLCFNELFPKFSFVTC